MKKTIMNGVLMGATVIALCACSSKTPGNGASAVGSDNPTLAVVEDVTQTTKENTVTESTVATETTAATESTVATEGTVITEDTIRSLMKENLNCMFNVFILSSLPRQGEPVEGDNIYQVDESAFADYAAFESYVRSVYSTETADMYLYNYPYEGDAKYINRDGKLCVNINYDGGKGYYADWSEYTVTIDSVSATECNFTLVATVEWPADKPVKEPYEVKGTAVFENGKWVLTKMLS